MFWLFWGMYIMNYFFSLSIAIMRMPLPFMIDTEEQIVFVVQNVWVFGVL